MSRIRDEQILTYALGRVFATDEATKHTIVAIIARHYQGVRLSSEDLAEIKAAGSPKPTGGSQDGGRVAVLPLWGTLVPHAGIMIDLSTEGTGLDEWRQQFNQLVADPTIGTILLRVNSPGGSAEGVTEAAKTIRDGRASKRIVAVADGMAASAAFCLASQADEFYVTPSGQVGAVHCYTLHQDISAALEQEGVKVTLIGAPDDGSAEAMSFLPLSEENLAHAQRMVGQFYDRFVSDVAAGRGIDASTVEAKFGRGRVLTAKDALAAGMVDGIQSFEDVLNRLVTGKPVGRGARQELEAPAIAAAAIAEARPMSLADAQTALARAGRSFIGAGSLSGSTAITQSSVGTPPAAAPATPAASGGLPTQGGNMDTLSIEGTPPSVEELAAEQTRLAGEMDDLMALAAGRAFTTDEQTRFDEFEAEHRRIGATLANIEDRENRRQALLADASRRLPGDGATVARGGIYSNVGRRGPVDIFDLGAYRSHARSVDELMPLWKDGAKRANASVAYRTVEADRTRMFVEALLEQDEGKSPHESFAHRMLITANPAYEAAFGRWVMGRESNADMGMIRMAVSNTGLGSETPVPVTIDPTVLYTGDGARSPLRALAQVVTITGLKWRGIGSSGVTMAYGAEAAVVNPQTPSFDAPDVQVEKANGEIQFTVEVDDDWPTLRSELQRMFGIAKANLEADKFLNGSGTNEPLGLLFELDDDGTSLVDTTTANTLAWADIEKVTNELPPSFDTNASWLAHKAFYTQARTLAAAEGFFDVWTPLAAGFQQASGATGRELIGSPAYTASEISKLFSTGGEEVAIVGDFAQGMVIIDRVGLNVELDPHPRDTNGKWTGTRALVCWFRNNTAVRTVNAFRVLRIKHT